MNWKQYCVQLKEESKMLPQNISYKDDEHAWHFAYGLFSGFPLCCVLWFCSTVKFIQHARFRDPEQSLLGNLQNTEYQVCPKCFLKNQPERLINDRNTHGNQRYRHLLYTRTL